MLSALDGQYISLEVVQMVLEPLIGAQHDDLEGSIRSHRKLYL